MHAAQDALPLLVPGATAGEPLNVEAPYDRRVIGRVATGGRGAADQALRNAREAFDDREAWLPLHERLAILGRAANALESRAESFAEEAAREGGKPLQDSRVEVARAVDGLRNCIEVMRTAAGSEIPMNVNAASAGRLAFTTREPIGTVVAISAFNHPLNLIVHQAAPAIATGCPVIVKPAEATPLTCMRFVQLLHEVGCPPTLCQALVTDSLETAGVLAADSRVDYLSFIGSARVGWMLRSRLAPGTRCALEHGGAAPVVMTRDADLDDAIPRLAKGAFYHAGQVCVSVQRILAHRDIASSVAERLATAAAALRVGDPVHETTDVGPLIRPTEVDRVEAWVRQAVDRGARCLTGGERLGATCYAPTVLLDPPLDEKVSREEVFGPVACVYSWDCIDDAIAIANDVPFAFQASIFSNDLTQATRAARRLRASAVMINDHTAFRVDWMPFGGLAHSGLGVGGIPHAIRDMQTEKLIVLRSDEID